MKTDNTNRALSSSSAPRRVVRAIFLTKTRGAASYLPHIYIFELMNSQNYNYVFELMNSQNQVAKKSELVEVKVF